MDTKNSSNTEKRHHRHRHGDYTISAGDLYERITGFRLPTQSGKRRARKRD